MFLLVWIALVCVAACHLGVHSFSIHPNVRSHDSYLLRLGATTAAHEVLETVDKAFESRQLDSAYATLHDMYQQDASAVQDSEELLWRYVKAHYELFAQSSNKQEQEEFLRTGADLVTRGLEQFPTSGYLLKWKAIVLGKLGSFQSTKEKMQNSFIIRDSLLQAMKELPDDASIQ